MRTVQSMRGDIERLESVVAEAESLASQSPAMRFAARGLRQVQADVERDLDHALRPELKVVIEGLPVRGHEIRVAALSRLLHSLQESISSVAQALTGAATARSSLPGPLRDQTALALAAVFPGSFGALLRGPVDEEAEERLASGQPLLVDSDARGSVLDLAVDTVLDLFDLASSDEVDETPIVEAVLPLGARSFKHLKDLSDAIVDNQMSATLEWTHLGLEEREVVLSRSVARRLDDVLQRNRMTESRVSISGRLGTASDLRNRAEIQTDDGQIIAAKVADEVAVQLADYFTHRVSADVLVTTLRSAATGIERNSYLIMGLATVPEETPLDFSE